MQQCPVILDLCLRKIRFEKLRFQIGFHPHENVKPRFTFSGLKVILEKHSFS